MPITLASATFLSVLLLSFPLRGEAQLDRWLKSPDRLQPMPDDSTRFDSAYFGAPWEEMSQQSLLPQTYDLPSGLYLAILQGFERQVALPDSSVTLCSMFFVVVQKEGTKVRAVYLMGEGSKLGDFAYQTPIAPANAQLRLSAQDCATPETLAADTQPARHYYVLAVNTDSLVISRLSEDWVPAN